MTTKGFFSELGADGAAPGAEWGREGRRPKMEATGSCHSNIQPLERDPGGLSADAEGHGRH